MGECHGPAGRGPPSRILPHPIAALGVGCHPCSAPMPGGIVDGRQAELEAVLRLPL
jgi:hypothetical protein